MGYSFTLFAEYFWFQHLLHKKHHTATFTTLLRFLCSAKVHTPFLYGCVGLSDRINMHIENTHTQHSTCRISAISIQLFCIPSRAVKNAISHGVVNMKNKHIRKSLPAVNYLSPDCIWPFTLLSVANYNPSLRTWCNLGIGMSSTTSCIQNLRKTQSPVCTVYLSHKLGNCSLFGYVLTTSEFYDNQSFTVMYSCIHKMWLLCIAKKKKN